MGRKPWQLLLILGGLLLARLAFSAEAAGPVLTGMLFLDRASAVKPGGVSKPGIDFGTVTLLNNAKLKANLTEFLGQKVTPALIAKISAAVVAYCREADRPLVDVAVPAGQDVTDGVLQIVLTQFRLGRVVTEGNHWFSDSLLRRQISAQPGDLIIGSVIKHDVDNFDPNPFRQMEMSYRPSPEPGKTDIVLKVKDQFPLMVTAAYDNTGTPSTSHDRWTLGFTWGNALWLDHQLNYQFATSDDFWHNRPDSEFRPDRPLFVGHTVNYTIPLPELSHLTVSGNYSESLPRSSDAATVMTSISAGAGLHYARPLQIFPDLSGTLTLGYDYKRTNSNLAFGGDQVSNNSSEINQISVEYDTAFPDSYGSTSAQFSVIGSPGYLTADDTATAYNTGRAGSRPRYAYLHLVLDRLTRLPWDGAWDLHVQSQVASENLLPSEELNAGGSSVLRGYDSGAATGDNGIMMSNELRAPPFMLAGLLKPSIADQTQLLAFHDFVYLLPRRPLAGDPRSSELQSTGLGLRYTIDPTVVLRLDYGFQLNRLSTETSQGQFGHFSLTFTY